MRPGAGLVEGREALAARALATDGNRPFPCAMEPWARRGITGDVIGVVRDMPTRSECSRSGAIPCVKDHAVQSHRGRCAGGSMDAGGRSTARLCRQGSLRRSMLISRFRASRLQRTVRS